MRSPRSKSSRWLLLAVAALLCWAGPAAARDAEPNAKGDVCLTDVVCRQLYKRARALSQAAQLESAVILYREAYERRPAAWILLNLGRVLHRQEKLAEAINAYRSFLATQHSDGDPRVAKARQYLEQAERDLQAQVEKGARARPAAGPTAPLQRIALPDDEPSPPKGAGDGLAAGAAPVSGANPVAPATTGQAAEPVGRPAGPAPGGVAGPTTAAASVESGTGPSAPGLAAQGTGTAATAVGKPSGDPPGAGRDAAKALAPAPAHKQAPTGAASGPASAAGARDTAADGGDGNDGRSAGGGRLGPGFWAGLAVTGGLAAVAVVTGGLALDGSSQLKGARFVGTTPGGDLQALQDRTRGLAVATDVLLGGAGVALWVTLVVTFAPRLGAGKRVQPMTIR